MDLALLPFPQQLALLPFPQQLALLDEQLAAKSDPGPLLTACSVLPDLGPLAHLLRALARLRRLDDDGFLLAFRALLDHGPETAVQEAFRALAPALPTAAPALPTPSPLLPDPLPDALPRLVGDACLRLPLARLPVLALALRWLARIDPDRRDALRRDAVERCRRALEQHRPPDDAWLVLAPLRTLRTHLDPALLPALDEAMSDLARRLLDTLASGPRTLSQANAEELLARRVYEQHHHFFFELLQNADDARATGARFSLTLAGAVPELWLRHDGAPFDARDVLGVLSVGQSTKEASDIGLFGVGFKSVAAVSERPRLYSGPFAFEIAAMARPRRVAPLDPPHGDDTLLALPLRPGLDPLALLEEAARLPPEILLTLPHLQQLEVVGDLPASPHLRATLTFDGRVATLHHNDRERRYLVARGASRSLLVAVLLDDNRRPTALPAGAPSLYCFLPTREETGLPVLIHARFEVPLDRERVKQDSALNAELLREGGALLARLLGELAAEGALAQAEALLALLADARPRPFFAGTLEEARRRAGELPLLAGADGTRLRAHEARQVPAALALALAGIALDGEGRRALAPTSTEGHRAAAWLGVAPLTAAELLALLEGLLAGITEGDPCDAPLLEATAPLAEELAGLPAPQMARLAALPWVRVAGRMHRASAVRLATGQQAALYGPLRPLRVEDRGAGGAWAKVGVAWLTDQEILDDLRDPERRGELLRHAGIDAWFAYLARLGPALLAGIGALPLFPDEEGTLRPLVGPDPAWLWPPPPLGSWLASLPAAPPALLQRRLQQDHPALLQALGGRVFGVEQLGAWLRGREIPLAHDEARSLAALAEATWRGWSPRELDALLRSPIFLTTQGQLAPLRGEGSALLPEDDELPGLAPGLPWLDPSLRGGSLVLGASVGALGPVSVLRSLLGEGPLFQEWPDLEPILAYLAPRTAALPRALCERVAQAPRWPGEDGQRWPLSGLSRPTPNEALERFYRSLGLRPRITGDGARLAALLGVEEQLAAGDFEGLLRDLQGGLVDGAGHREELIALLRLGQRELPPKMLPRIAELPLFLATDGRLRPLAPWTVRSSAGPCYRAYAPWRGTLLGGSLPLLHEEEEERWGPLLDDTGCAPASPRDWLAALEQDPALGAPEARLLARATLCAPGSSGELASLQSRVARLPLWRDQDGVFHPAERLVEPAALDRLLGEPAAPLLAGGSGPPPPGGSGTLQPGAGPPQPGAEALRSGAEALRPGAEALRPGAEALRPGEPGLLHPGDLADARLLGDLFVFCPPVALLEAWIQRAARPGRPLAEQPRLLGTLPLLWKLHGIARTHDRTGWPLGVDAEGNLSGERLLGASEDEVELLRGTALLRRLALPAWAAGVPALDPLPAARLLDALAPSLRERGTQDDPGLPAARRALLFAWIERRGDEIARDPQARGILGKTHAFPTRDGALRSPRELLLTPGLGALDLPGRPSEELSPGLLALLSRLFRLDDGALDTLVGALLEASHQAAEAGDLPGLDRLNRALAGALGPSASALGASAGTLGPSASALGASTGTLGPSAGTSSPDHEAAIERILRRHRLGKRLRFANGEGPPRKARELLLCSPERHRQIQRFHPDAPPRHEGPEELEPLLRRLGASSWLDADDLQARMSLEGRKPGFEASLELARYLADAATATPSLRPRLDLDRARWVPAHDGALYPPSALFWPEPGLESYLEDHPEVAVHPLFARTVPPSLGRWFPFRRLRDVPSPSATSSPSPRGPSPSSATPSPSPSASSRSSSAGLSPSPSAPVLGPGAPSKSKKTPPLPEPPPNKPRSFWQRWFGPDEPPPAPTPPPPAAPPPSASSSTPRRVQEERWYRPQEGLAPQLGGTEGWMESRKQKPRFGFAHTPGKLPAPYTYAPALLATRFDPATQRWERGETPGLWTRSGGPAVGRVAFRGEVPRGEVVLPRPLYGEVVAVEGEQGAISWSWTADGLVLLAMEDRETLSFEVDLHESPQVRDDAVLPGEVPPELLARTVPDEELPREVLDWLEALQGQDLSLLARALRVRDFIRERYRYDPSYLEDERVARWLRRSAEGSRNLHLAALHAGRGGKHLGAGVCYELNGLCCELLRRAGIPAAVSTGWVLSGDQVDEPDHLWAMALLPTDQGPRFLPLDASTTRDGVPLRVPRRPAGSFRRPAAPATRLPAAPSWAAQQPTARTGSPTPPITELARTLRYLAWRQGAAVPDEGTLRRQARALLEDPEQVRRLLELFRGE